MSEAPPIRIHVLLRSTEPNLQNERSLFEINSNTSVKELKQAIIQRLDDRQVTRTFYEQVVLSFREEVFPNDPGSDELTVPSLLQLTNDDIREMNNVIPVNLQIKSSVNGILSREFWQDLTADDRFDFLPIINQEAERTQNEDTIPPDMAMVDPMKIVVGDDRVWHLTGTSYESISNGQGSNKLVNQDGISLKVYEISSASNEHEKVVLNTSHCIIVDNGQHQPYMLLSPAGIAKVDSVFKLQKVKVVLHNLTNTAQTPAPAQEQGAQVQVEDDVLARVVTAGKRLLMLTFQIALVLLMLGYKPNKHMQENWIKYLILIIVLFNIYILFFTGENRVQRLAENDIDLANQPPATQNFIHIVRRLARARENVAGIVVGVQDELVTIVASCTWDFEYIMSKEPNWYFVIASNFENIWKDALIYVLSILPTFQVKLYDELHKQKQMELKVFEDKVRLFYDLVLLLIQEYNKEYTPQFILPHNVALEPVLEILETLREDEKFEFLVKYYKCMKSIYDVFNKAYVKHKSLTNEQIDFLNGESDRFIAPRN